MQNLLKHALVACGFVVVFMVAAGKANADPLVLSLQNNSLTAVAGGSVTFSAFATNTGTTNTNTVTITNGAIVLNGGAISFTVDGSPFGANWAGQMVANGVTLGPLSLFTLNIPVGTLDGIYHGSVLLEYLSAAGQNQFSNSADWTVTVSSPAPVPEPTTMLLLGTGLAGIAAKVRKRRKAV
jgi:hypothetical protein